MLSIRILSPGKTKEQWLTDALGEYLKRLKPVISIEFITPRDDEQLAALVRKEKNIILLDPQGKSLTSDAFCTMLYNSFEAGGSRITFVIGGPEGLPESLKEHGALIRLSSMTFTHQMTRLVLLEQIYRSTEIRRGSSYHK